MSKKSQEFLEGMINGYIPEGPERNRALEAVGLLGMQADRDTRAHQVRQELPRPLTGPKALEAMGRLRDAFRKVTGMNVFDSRSEALVRAAWDTVRAIVLDERDRLSQEYENSGIQDTPDLDTATELALLTEMPQEMHHLLWSRD